MRDIAAQERRVQHAGQFDIVDEQRLAGQESCVLIAFDRRAKAARRHGVSPAAFGGLQHGLDDVLIAGATAEIAGQCFAYLRFVRGSWCSSRNAVMVIRMPGVQ